MTRRLAKEKEFIVARRANQSLEHILTDLNGSTLALTDDDAIERLGQYGINGVAHEKKPHALMQLITAFHNPFIYQGESVNFLLKNFRFDE
ncbi:cation-transporting P-type ATPase [Xenorhabdus sp. SGI240]|uniref:cation-transporting P-type ATPase n=1 Tax=Xenorhabdus sp. SGI240 TaxID=3158262 RepID=UPI0032B74FB4